MASHRGIVSRVATVAHMKELELQKLRDDAATLLTDTQLPMSIQTGTPKVELVYMKASFDYRVLIALKIRENIIMDALKCNEFNPGSPLPPAKRVLYDAHVEAAAQILRYCDPLVPHIAASGKDQEVFFRKMTLVMDHLKARLRHYEC